MENWTELRTAYQVAKLGTVSAAATTLGLHRATVNRHIDILEQKFGARIFLRHARGYTPTELGEDVLRVAGKIEELVDDLSGRAGGGNAQIQGELKVTVLPPFIKVLMEPVRQFRADNPHCRVTIIATEDLQRLEYGEAHIALRAGPMPDHPDYVVKLFGKIGLNLYAHDSYIARRGMPREPEELSAHEFVVLPPEEDGRLPFWPWIAENISTEQVSVSSKHERVATEAVMAGLGLGFLSDFDVAGRSDLHAVLPPNEDWTVPVWLVTHVDLHRTEKVQAMLRCIRAVRPSET